MTTFSLKILKNPITQSVAMASLVLLLAGCANTGGAGDDASSRDPFEPVNRQVFEFNEQLDKYILKPVAETYVEYSSEPVRKGVHNFVTNLTEPKTAVNSFLQGNFKNFGNSTTRFLVNIAFGYGGVVDRATKEGITSTSEDFGQTLAVWGAPAGPYIVLPFLGSSNVRDTIGKVVDTLALDPFSLAESNAGGDQYLFYIERGVYIVDKRALFLGTVDTLRNNSVDFYAKVRNIFWQEELRNVSGTMLNTESASQDANFDEFFDGNAGQ